MTRCNQHHITPMGTHYHPATPDRLCGVLDALIVNQTRVAIQYGDPNTGVAWGDRPEVGRVSRSLGPVKVPILVHNRRSLGGGAILTNCIISIATARGKRPIYETQLVLSPNP